MMKRFSICMMACLVAAFAAFAPAEPATQPSAKAPSVTEIRALEEFNRGNWAVALPLLKKVATELANEPSRLGAIQEDIRVCQKNARLATDAKESPFMPAPVDVAKPPVAPTLVGDKRTPHPAPVPGKTIELAIKDLGNFDYDADHGGNVPADVKALTGATIKLKGFMIPMDQADSITQFALVPSLFACCYGQPPQVQHTIIVHAPKGKSVSYYPDEISVEGKLTVDEKKEDGFVVSLFEIDCDSVKPTAK